MKKLLLILGFVLVFSGCTTSRYYQFYPDQNGTENGPNATTVKCGHVDLIITGGINGRDHLKVGDFCRVESK